MKQIKDMNEKIIVGGVPISEEEFEIANRLVIPLHNGTTLSPYKCLIVYS